MSNPGYVATGRYFDCRDRNVSATACSMSVFIESLRKSLNCRVVSKTCTNEYPVVATVAAPRASQNWLAQESDVRARILRRQAHPLRTGTDIACRQVAAALRSSAPSHDRTGVLLLQYQTNQRIDHETRQHLRLGKPRKHRPFSVINCADVERDTSVNGCYWLQYIIVR